MGRVTTHGGRAACGAQATRSGHVALAGRPNVGKSTLVNAVVGEKVVIVSDRPQTTRRAIRGVYTRDRRQLVLVDLPGVQRPRDELTARMAGRVRRELDGADAALLLIDGEQGVGPGDRFIAASLTRELPRVIAVNKVDRLSRSAIAAALQQAGELGLDAEIFPVSARTGAGMRALVDHLLALMPRAPLMFAPGERSDQPRELLLAELVREAVIRRTRQEVPHAVEVIIEEFERPRAELARVRALIWVESASQRGILVGAGGRMVKAIGTAARSEMERELGCHVHLELSVRVRRDWRVDESLLDRLGIT